MELLSIKPAIHYLKKPLKLCENSDAILLGAVGGPKWANQSVRPEQGLLKIRKHFNLFANLRPVTIFDALESSSPLKKKLFKVVI